jgi:hypothetical protein
MLLQWIILIINLIKITKMFKVEYLIPFLIKNNLTTSQFYLLYCIHHKLYDTIDLYRKHFPSDNPTDTSMIGKSATNDLLLRGFLIKEKIKDKVVNGTKIPVYKYSVGEAFKEIYVTENIAFKELLSAYPNQVTLPNETSPIFTKNVNIAELKQTYLRKIEKNSYEHLEVMKDLSFALKYKKVDFTFDVFIKEEKWEIFREIRLKEYLSNNLKSFENIVFMATDE